MQISAQTVNKGSSLVFDIPAELPDYLKTGRVAAYIKLRRSDAKTIPIDAIFTDNRASIRVTLNANRSLSLPVGRVIYFVEVSNGIYKEIQSEYLLVEP